MQHHPHRSAILGSAIISFFFLISWASAFAGDQHGFSIKVFTSPDDQFWTNSVIIEGTHEVILVDAQLTKTSAAKVVQEIRETKKHLSIVYITHEHADHFLGLEVFKEAYPRARIIANSAVADRINKVYQEKIDKWKTILGSAATSQVVAIEKFDGHFVEFEGSPGREVHEGSLERFFFYLALPFKGPRFLCLKHFLRA